METLAVIPARRNSQRFPGKHHALLLGKPMFAYTLEAALDSGLLDRIVVSSDDLDLKPLAESYGVEFMERPAELSSETSPLEDALRHAVRVLLDRDRFSPDVILALQGNVPVRKEGQVDEVIRRFEDLPAATAVCTARQVRLRPEWAKVIKDEKTMEAIPFVLGNTGYRAQDYPPLFMLDGAVCAVKRQTLFATEGGRVSGHAWLGDRLHVVIQEHPMYSLEVDYPDEKPLAEHYLLYQRSGSLA